MATYEYDSQNDQLSPISGLPYADINALKESLTDNIEPSTTATSPHSVGDFITYGYPMRYAKVIQAISIGDTIANGINVDNCTIGEVLKQININKANKIDLSNISITGTTNNTGSSIASGTYFYLNGALVKAKTAIANNATLTLNTNYEVVTAGGLNELLAKRIYLSTTSGITANGLVCYKIGNLLLIHGWFQPSSSTSYCEMVFDNSITFPDTLAFTALNYSAWNNKDYQAITQMEASGHKMVLSGTAMAIPYSFVYIDVTLPLS